MKFSYQNIPNYFEMDPETHGRLFLDMDCSFFQTLEKKKTNKQKVSPSERRVHIWFNQLENNYFIVSDCFHER